MQNRPTTRAPHTSVTHHMGLPRMLRLRDVLVIIGMSKSSVYEMIAKDQFPKPIKLTGITPAWVALEVRAWLDERIAERDGEKEKGVDA
jgi:prophage regulatory protein